MQRPLLRRQHDLLVEVSVAVVSDHRRAFRHEAAHATEMIEVIVGVDQVADWLVGEELVDFGDYCVGALVAQRPGQRLSTPFGQLSPDGRCPSGSLKNTLACHYV